MISEHREHGFPREFPSSISSDDEHYPDFYSLLVDLSLPDLHHQSVEVERMVANHQNRQLRMGKQIFQLKMQVVISNFRDCLQGILSSVCITPVRPIIGFLSS